MTANRYLQLRRLVILAGGEKVYDEQFHRGVNIIRGKNSSGKSTVTEMIFHVLGGEGVKWSSEAQQCDWVYAECDVSGTIYSLRRELGDSSAPPIGVVEADLDEALASAVGWSSYTRTRSDAKESFSKLMFAKVGFPEVRAEDSQLNVTMHQVLRVLYGDQHTDATSIFRREKQPFADRTDLRKGVGEMLLGIDDLRGHGLRTAYLEATRSYASKKARLDSLQEAASAADPRFSLSNYSNLILETERELDLKDPLIFHVKFDV